MQAIYDSIMLFVLTFLAVYFIYYIFTLRSCKKNNEKSLPVEMKYLIYKYKINLKKVDFKKFTERVGIVGSLDISIVVTIVSLINSLILQFIVGFIILVPIVLLSYKLFGNYYKKKGMTNDENN